MSTQKPQSSSAWDVLLALIQKVNVQIFLFALGFGILLIIGLNITPRVDQVFTKIIWALLAIYVIAVVAYLYSRMTKRPANSRAEMKTLQQKPSSAPTQPAEREHNVYNDETVTTSRILDIRHQLNRSFDDAQLVAFLLDYFPEIYDRLGRGMLKDEKLTLLLDHCRRSETRFQYLLSCLERAEK